MNVSPTDRINREYYAWRLDGATEIEVRPTDSKGKGAFATCFIPEGKVLVQDRPIVSMREHVLTSPYTSCLECQRIVGSVGSQLRGMGIDRVDPSHISPSLEKAGAIEAIPCQSGCDAVFCSETCRAGAWNSHHGIMCRGGSAGEGLAQFDEVVRETNPIFELAARLVSSIVAAYQHGLSFDDAVRPFALVHKVPWWDVLKAAESAAGNDTEGLEESARAAVTAASVTFCKAVTGKPPCPPTADFRRKDAECGAVMASANALGAVRPDDSGNLCIDWHPVFTTMVMRGELRRNAPRPGMAELPAVGLEMLPCFSPAFWAMMVGAFEVNNVSVEIEPQLPTVCARLLGRGDASVRGVAIAMSVAGKKLADAEMRRMEFGSIGSEEWAALKQELDDSSDEELDDMEAEFQADMDASFYAQGGVAGMSRIAQSLVEHQHAFPPCEGTALFPVVSTLNHSCDPNCTVRYSADNAMAHLVTKENVKEGEELTISYVDEAASLTERRAALVEYGFVCECSMCRLQAEGEQEEQSGYLQDSDADGEGDDGDDGDDDEGDDDEEADSAHAAVAGDGAGEGVAAAEDAATKDVRGDATESGAEEACSAEERADSVAGQAATCDDHACGGCASAKP